MCDKCLPIGKQTGWPVTGRQFGIEINWNTHEIHLSFIFGAYGCLGSRPTK